MHDEENVRERVVNALLNAMEGEGVATNDRIRAAELLGLMYGLLGDDL